MADIYAGDYGVPHDITIKENGVAVNIQSATLMQLTYKKPDGSTLVKTPAFKTNGTDGVITYTFEQGDIDANDYGTWKYQAYVETATSGKHTAHGTLEVGSNLS